MDIVEGDRRIEKFERRETKKRRKKQTVPK